MTEVESSSQVSGSGAVAILSNNGSEAVRAVNALLDAGKAVGMIAEGENKGDFVMSYGDFASVSDDYALVAVRTDEMPVAREIEKPTLFLTGRYADFGDDKVTSGYYTQWFADGYGFINYDNIHNNGTSNYDVESYAEQLGFTITDDPAKADIIVGNVALDQGETGAAAVAAVKAGTPYIATGSDPLGYITENLVTDLAYTTLGMEALHTVSYPADSLITASYAADEDYVMYTYSCGVLTSVPADATVLIQAIDEDSFIAGCCLNEDGTPIDGFVEAIALERNGMDLTIFANSVNNRAHQQDDYRYVTNTIYAKMLSDEQMQLSTLPFTDVDPDDWFYDEVAYAYENGLMGGTSGSTFSPGTATDRAMMATLLWRLDGAPVVNYLMDFGDVAEGLWYSEAVRWAASEDVVKGVGDGSNYAPTATITREQMAVMLYRYAQYKGYDVSGAADLSGYADVDSVSDWADQAVAWAVDAGLIGGVGGSRLNPGGSASRAEIATLLMRFCQAYPAQ